MARRRTGPGAATVQMVLQRSGGMCEARGDARAAEIQHRQARGMGGSRHNPAINAPSNLLHMCRDCHRWTESVERGRAKDYGWWVPRPLVPAEVPVLYRGRWVYLTDNGSVIDMEGAA